MKSQKIIALFLIILAPLGVSAQKWYTSDIDGKVDDILKKMTVEEKLSYIGGVDWMYTRNIDRLGIHRMKMSDGPQGLGTHGQSTAYPATARIVDNKVIVSSEKVPYPVAVRYAWANNPECNLYNKTGLPASPFRTDDWPGVTLNNK